MTKTGLARKNISRERSPRVKASFPMTVADGGTGVTKDISATGIYFEVNSKQEEGNVISFWVELDTPGGKLKLVCEGEIVRVEEDGGKTRVATKIISQEIEALIV
ncbi:PilZ domain-containing protein [Polynucleobacter sp. 71A-WALBACH]|uniref:PilZ domain-containing protein n=1 Tax=Polynucleobacter sp. 71A-WALBACH TaxID=2689097 RepID=UPI002104D084|nr:PilZ domain-containing protein [Polynucleobacter sp. 71A-WALBACH]